MRQMGTWPVSAAMLVVLAIAGCSPAHQQQASSRPTSCESDYIRDQFVGTWNEDDSPGVNILNPDGTLLHSALGDTYSGTWDLARWRDTPGKPTPGDENACVLWLKFSLPYGPVDFLYAPLSVSVSTIKLSYMERGNTIAWNRANKT